MNRLPLQSRRSRRRPAPRVAGWVEMLESRVLLAAPVVEPIADVSLPAGKSLFVPVQGSDADGDILSYTVSSTSTDVQLSVRTGHPYLRISVAGFGNMDFQLFDDLAPNTVAKIRGLVDANFYDNLTFHRVVPGFVIQGGDPLGNGTGGPGFQFDDEFHPDAIFTGDGQLAMANSGKDTNGSQFFVTIGPERHLDFNHTIFGQLVRGRDVLTAINQVPTGPAGRPLTPVVITDAAIVANTTDTVLQVRAPAGSGRATIIVTARDPAGNTTSEPFSAQFAPDPTALNDPPILGPVGDQTAVAGFSLSIPLTSIDLEDEPVEYSATIVDNPAAASVVVEGSNVVVRPTPGFLGTFRLRVGVKQQGATDRGSPGSDPFDLQTIQVQVVPLTIVATGVPLSAEAGVATTVVAARFTANGGTAADFNAVLFFDGDLFSGDIGLPGTIVANDQGGFDVVRTLTFTAVGTFPVRVDISGTGGATATARTTATATPPRGSRVTIGLATSAERVSVGQDLTYTVTISSTGIAPAWGLNLTFLLPGGVTFISSTSAPTSISTAGDVLTIPLGDLPVGESRSLQIVVRPTAGGTIASTALVTSSVDPTLTATRSTMTIVQGSGSSSTTNPATGPQVSDVSRRRNRTGRTRIDLTFGSDLDPARAEDVRNYVLITPGRDGRSGTRDDVRVPIAASYDAATRVVTLMPRRRGGSFPSAVLRIRSGGASGLTDTGGRPLDGDQDGLPGGEFQVRLGRADRPRRTAAIRTGMPMPAGPVGLFARNRDRPS